MFSHLLKNVSWIKTKLMLIKKSLIDVIIITNITVDIFISGLWLSRVEHLVYCVLDRVLSFNTGFPVVSIDCFPQISLSPQSTVGMFVPVHLPDHHLQNPTGHLLS